MLVMCVGNVSESRRKVMRCKSVHSGEKSAQNVASVLVERDNLNNHEKSRHHKNSDILFNSDGTM
jgi:hypothetical protein